METGASGFDAVVFFFSVVGFPTISEFDAGVGSVAVVVVVVLVVSVVTAAPG